MGEILEELAATLKRAEVEISRIRANMETLGKNWLEDKWDFELARECFSENYQWACSLSDLFEKAGELAGKAKVRIEREEEEGA